jgi:hypothetical protein
LARQGRGSRREVRKPVSAGSTQPMRASTRRLLHDKSLTHTFAATDPPHDWERCSRHGRHTVSDDGCAGGWSARQSRWPFGHLRRRGTATGVRTRNVGTACSRSGHLWRVRAADALARAHGSARASGATGPGCSPAGRCGCQQRPRCDRREARFRHQRLRWRLRDRALRRRTSISLPSRSSIYRKHKYFVK